MNAHQQAAWIKHKGGKQPAGAVGRVDVRFRRGAEVLAESADGWRWYHLNFDYDIVAWRPHVAAQPAQSEGATNPDITAYAASLAAEIERLRIDLWRAGSRFNCMVLDRPSLPDRAAYASNSDYLRACERAVDARMTSVIAKAATGAVS